MRFMCSHCKHIYGSAISGSKVWQNERVCLACYRDLKALWQLKKMRAKPVSVRIDDIESDLLNNKKES